MLYLSSKHLKTLKDVFTRPPKSNVEWRDIEQLFAALGAEIEEGNGSRIRIYLNGVIAVFHSPHPRKEIDKGALVSVRKFLQNAGVNPDEI